jgi:hypothetical protein
MVRFRFLSVLLCVVICGAVLGADGGPLKPAKIVPRELGGQGNSPAAISGVASSARNCIGPAGSNVHALGWVPSASQVTVSFTSDFDPVAAISVAQLGEDAPDQLARMSIVADDDGGGNLEPEVRFTTSYAGTLVLHVSKFSNDASSGCYFYKVEVRTP